MTRRSTAAVGPVALLLLVPLAGAAAPKEQTALSIEPGPDAMTPVESRIEADPASGIQHGVIVLEETVFKESMDAYTVISHHVRAKILSNEGRSLADVEIPVYDRRSNLKRWWGKTILPDGTVIPFLESQLTEQVAAKTAAGKSIVLKAALPGVVPGAVIDYGYVVSGVPIPYSRRIFLQRTWPVRLLRLRWEPSTFMASAYSATQTNGKNIRFSNDSLSVKVVAEDMTPVPDEPHMPPAEEVRASVTFYYSDGRKPAEFWDVKAKNIERVLKSYLGGTGTIREWLDTVSIPADAPTEAKLDRVYAWIAANIKNTSLLSAEEEERRSGDEDESERVKEILLKREGEGWQLDGLFAGAARALGAEAYLAFATDRTDHFWNPNVPSFEQFNYRFVAFRLPGEPDEAFRFVDAGSGLPFGQVPWPATGGTALICTPKGAVRKVIAPAGPRENRADTIVRISFSEGNESILAKWSRAAQGASGMSTRRWLRDLDLPDRRQRLEELCGGTGSASVLSADAPGLDTTSEPFRLECELEVGESGLGEDIGTYSFSLVGAWWPALPELTSPERRLPIIFDHPELEIVSLDLSAPDGFSPSAPPAPVEVSSPFGRYQFVAKPIEGGFHVDRGFSLFPLVVKTEDYAALREFLQQVRNADRTALVFVRKGVAR